MKLTLIKTTIIEVEVEDTLGLDLLDATEAEWGVFFDCQENGRSLTGVKKSTEMGTEITIKEAV